MFWIVEVASCSRHDGAMHATTYLIEHRVVVVAAVVSDVFMGMAAVSQRLAVIGRLAAANKPTVGDLRYICSIGEFSRRSTGLQVKRVNTANRSKTKIAKRKRSINTRDQPGRRPPASHTPAGCPPAQNAASRCAAPALLRP